MKTKIVLITLFVIAALIAMACGNTSSETARQSARSQQTPSAQTQTQSRVPAHFENASSIGTLAPTLAPERFIGPTQEAYKIAREIPETLAQLPCYCHCDMSMGHKSLHSCFEDLHASQCAVCVTEALMADDMQKNGLTPAQIRERIITVYS
ncbi:MAG: hypothetical protein QOC96_3226, partial [Acidobacteriota bacterium]|nr:hypothetical protein [Acidobacteriota bacterium]